MSTGIIREQNNLSRYIQHPRHGTKPGQYTDDTQMSIAIAEAIVSGEEWTASDAGGPMGVFPTIAEVIARCELQAAITHNTPDGIQAAVAALMTHYFLYDLGPKAQLGAFLEQQVPGDWSEPWRGKVGHQGLMSARDYLRDLDRKLLAGSMQR